MGGIHAPLGGTCEEQGISRWGRGKGARGGVASAIEGEAMKGGEKFSLFGGVWILSIHTEKWGGGES